MANKKRPTKTIKTPEDKIEVEYKEYITGREAREVKSSVQDLINFEDIDQVSGTPDLSNLKGSEVSKVRENKKIEVVIESVDGEDTKIVDRVLDMKAPDYNAVMKRVNIVFGGENFTKGKGQ